MELEWMGNGEREKKREEENKIKKYEKCRKSGENAENKLELKHRSQVEINNDEAKLFLENSNWLKTKEAAEYLRTSPKQIRKWVYQGRINAYKLLGKSLRFKKTELDLLFKGGQSWE